MVEMINEKIKVGAVFSGAKIAPKWFYWKNKKYDIKQVSYFWDSKKGASNLKFFSVSADDNLYELCFDTGNMEWKLTKVYMEG